MKSRKQVMFQIRKTIRKLLAGGDTRFLAESADKNNEESIKAKMAELMAELKARHK